MKRLLVGLGAVAVVTSLVAAAPAPIADTAATVHGWGDPLPEWSDEFDYGSEASPAVPDQGKWSLAGGGVDQCWPGHAGNGQRCDKNTRRRAAPGGRGERRLGLAGVEVRPAVRPMGGPRAVAGDGPGQS